MLALFARVCNYHVFNSSKKVHRTKSTSTCHAPITNGDGNIKRSRRKKWIMWDSEKSMRIFVMLALLRIGKVNEHRDLLTMLGFHWQCLRIFGGDDTVAIFLKIAVCSKFDAHKRTIRVQGMFFVRPIERWIGSSFSGWWQPILFYFMLFMLIAGSCCAACELASSSLFAPCSSGWVVVRTWYAVGTWRRTDL